MIDMFPFKLRLDPTYLKAYYRRASGNYALGKLKEALKDFKAVAKIYPRDVDLEKKFNDCKQELQAESFNEAMVINFLPEDFYSHSQVDAIPVESSYDGPRLPHPMGSSSNDESSSSESIVSMKFVHELISCFKNSKSLHKKYVLSSFLHNSKCCIHSFILCHCSRAHSLSAI